MPTTNPEHPQKRREHNRPYTRWIWASCILIAAVGLVGLFLTGPADASPITWVLVGLAVLGLLLLPLLSRLERRR